MHAITFFETQKGDIALLDEHCHAHNIEILPVTQKLTMESVDFAKNSLAVSVHGSNVVGRDILEKLHAQGVKYLSVRSSGYNNVDIAAAHELALRVSNVTYSSNSVADYTVMLILMCIRKIKQIIYRNDVQDYSLPGVLGKEVRNLTVGIIGTGKIGETVARNLSGFQCRILAYDLYPKEQLRSVLEYASLDEVITNSDVITLHLPYDKASHHLLNHDAFSRMKNGVAIINCGRGPLIDTQVLIEHLENGKVSAAGLDVIEDELDIFHQDHRLSILKNRNLSILRAMPNVIVSPHVSFYTDQAISDMTTTSLKSLQSFIDTDSSLWEVF